MNGIVLSSSGGVYEVETSGGVVDASLRGRLKREDRVGDRVVVGDHVRLARGEDAAGGAWTIEAVEDRQSQLIRKAPGKAPRPKVIAANIDQVLIVFAATHPDPNLRMLDRFLVLCESNELAPLIVINKIDLVPEGSARETFKIYEEIGYRVIYTAAHDAVGLEELREKICGVTSALTGPSGVGKSSLLNAIQPGLALRVSSVSEAVQKGRHTTVTARLVPLDCGGYVADTPGLRELGLWEIEADQLGFYFPEFEPFLGNCRYSSSCTHTHEPGCAVKAAVEDGAIHPSRYESFVRLIEGDEERE